VSKPTLRFKWQHADENPSDVTFTLWENDQPVVENIAVMDFDLLMEGKPEGVYRYNVTAEKFGMMSEPTPTITVNFTKPSAPFDLEISWVV
jgi:hypothetical protein